MPRVIALAVFLGSPLLLVCCGGCGGSDEKTPRRPAPLDPAGPANAEKEGKSTAADGRVSPELLAYLRRPSRLDWSRMQPGEVGRLGEFEVLQVVDSGAVLIKPPEHSDAGPVVMVRGIKTSGLKGGSRRRYEVPFRVTGVEGYLAESGTIRNVPLLRLVSAAELERAQRALAEVIARERERLEEMRRPEGDRER